MPILSMQHLEEWMHEVLAVSCSLMLYTREGGHITVTVRAACLACRRGRGAAARAGPPEAHSRHSAAGGLHCQGGRQADAGCPGCAGPRCGHEAPPADCEAAAWPYSSPGASVTQCRPLQQERQFTSILCLATVSRRPARSVET